MDTPELWQFTSSHFNEKARWALDFKRVPHIRHSMIPGFHVPVIKRMTGKTHVPVLKLDGTAISDSSRIIEALERAYPEPPLYPGDSDERRRALELEEYYDEELGPYLRRWVFHVILPYPEFMRALFVSHASPAAQLAQRAMSPLIGRVMRRQMDINPASAEIARAKTMAAMDRLASEVRPSGYLVGDRFTVADLTAAALLSPLVRPPEFPYKAAGPLPEPFAKIRESLSTHPAFRWTLQTYRQHRGESAEVAAQAECLAEQGGWRQDRDSPAAVAPPGIGEKAAEKARATAPQIDAVEMPRRLGAQSSRRPSAVCSPVVPTLSGCRKSPPTPASLIPPFCITSAAAKAWSKRWSCGVSRGCRRNSSKDGPAPGNPISRACSSAFTKSLRIVEWRGCSRGLFLPARASGQ